MLQVRIKKSFFCLKKYSIFHIKNKGDAAFSSGFATILNAALILNGKSPLSIGDQVGIGIAITFVWAVQNALRIDQQGWLYTLGTFFQIISTVSVVIALLVMAPQRATAKDVFTSTYNGTGFSFAYVCCIGILSTLFSFAGYEGRSYRQSILQRTFSYCHVLFFSWCSFG
jgi:amino acid transporter